MVSRRYFYLSLATLFLYGTLVLIGVHAHEPWFDEAQAWLLSRDSRLDQLFSTYLRYEGSPGLWHLLLAFPAKYGLPYVTMQIMSACIAICGVTIFLRYAPFPIYLRVFIPFSYFIFYQYAIVARSYVLMPFLLFLIAHTYPDRRQKLGRYVLYLVLLSHVSLHGAIIAFCMATLDLLDLWRSRQLWDAALRRRTLFAYAFLLISGLLVGWELRFPSDHAFVQPKHIYQLDSTLKFTMKYLSNALTESRDLSNVIVLLSCWYFWKTHTLRLFLVPLLILGHLFALAYVNVWHEGVLFLLWLFCFWISLNQDQRLSDQLNSRDLRAMRKARRLALSSLALVLAIHVDWSWKVFRNDLRYTYSAAEEVAAHLQAHVSPTQSIYATGFHSIAILPYFRGNIFSNYGYTHQFAFWDWSLKNDMVQDLNRIECDAPDVIIFGIKSRFANEAPVIPGYVAKKFPGALYWKNRILEEDAYVIYEKKSKHDYSSCCARPFFSNPGNLTSCFKDRDLKILDTVINPTRRLSTSGETNLWNTRIKGLASSAQAPPGSRQHIC